MVFHFLAYLLCCQLQTVYVLVAEVPVYGEFLGRIFARNSRASGSLSSLFVCVHVSRH